jgi:hypothetical protein
VGAEYTYDYAILRVVPRVERGERVNVGVILSCVDEEFLDVRIEVDERRLLMLDAEIDLEAVRAALESVVAVCAGQGPIGALSPRERFRWLVSPRSTVIQLSAVHTGRTTDPQATLERLMDTMVRQRTTPSP